MVQIRAHKRRAMPSDGEDEVEVGNTPDADTTVARGKRRRVIVDSGSEDEAEQQPVSYVLSIKLILRALTWIANRSQSSSRLLFTHGESNPLVGFPDKRREAGQTIFVEH